MLIYGVQDDRWRGFEDGISQSEASGDSFVQVVELRSDGTRDTAIVVIRITSSSTPQARGENGSDEYFAMRIQNSVKLNGTDEIVFLHLQQSTTPPISLINRPIPSQTINVGLRIIRLSLIRNSDRTVDILVKSKHRQIEEERLLDDLGEKSIQ